MKAIPYRTLQQFTEGELSMMIDVLNGTIIDEFTVSHVLRANIEDSFLLYPGMYQEKWGLDGSILIEKICILTDEARIWLTIWARAFWDIEGRDLKDYVHKGKGWRLTSDGGEFQDARIR